MCDSAQQKVPVVNVGRCEMNRTEKQKMLAGEPYNAWDEELYGLRIECRKTLQRLNNAIPDSTEWREAIDQLIPQSQGAYLEPPFRCDYGANITLGKNFYANFNCVVLDVAPVVIGDNVLFAPNVQIYTAGHPLDVKSRVEEGIEFGTPITIGNNVWLGGHQRCACQCGCGGQSVSCNSDVGRHDLINNFCWLIKNFYQNFPLNSL